MKYLAVCCHEVVPSSRVSSRPQDYCRHFVAGVVEFSGSEGTFNFTLSYDYDIFSIKIWSFRQEVEWHECLHSTAGESNPGEPMQGGTVQVRGES